MKNNFKFFSWLLLMPLTLMFMNVNAQSIYNYKLPGLTGGTVDFGDLKGKKILIVNTASECGFTSQYDGLEKLYNIYKNANFVIIGIPSNNFMSQEPGTNEEIAAFCRKNYGVTFPMTEKANIKGKNRIPLYDFLDAEAEKIGVANPVTWNFSKFLFDESGELIAVFTPKTDPMDESIIKLLSVN